MCVVFLHCFKIKFALEAVNLDAIPSMPFLRLERLVHGQVDHQQTLARLDQQGIISQNHQLDRHE